MAKFSIKSIKTSEEFDSYINFIENEIKLFNDMKSMIVARISQDRQYCRSILMNTIKKGNYLDGFIIEKVSD
jgi:hypothetical protein